MTRLLTMLLALPSLAVGEPRHFAIVSDESRIVVHVGRSGLLKFAGHEHEVVTTSAEGEIVADAEDLASSSVRVRVPTASLRVTGAGEPAKDVPKVQARMEGPDVLDVSRFPVVELASESVSGRRTAPGEYALTLKGTLTVHGVSRPIEVPVAVKVDGDVLTAVGRLVVRQKDHGIRPVSVAGVVNVKNEVEVEFHLAGRAQAAGSVK